jgi:hypothetical protein
VADAWRAESSSLSPDRATFSSLAKSRQRTPGRSERAPEPRMPPAGSAPPYLQAPAPAPAPAPEATVQASGPGQPRRAVADIFREQLDRSLSEAGPASDSPQPQRVRQPWEPRRLLSPGTCCGVARGGGRV